MPHFLTIGPPERKNRSVLTLSSLDALSSDFSQEVSKMEIQENQNRHMPESIKKLWPPAEKEAYQKLDLIARSAVDTCTLITPIRKFNKDEIKKMRGKGVDPAKQICKAPLLQKWNELGGASYNPLVILNWSRLKNWSGRWGVPTKPNRFFILDQDGKEWGILSRELMEQGYLARTTKGTHYIFEAEDRHKDIKSRVRLKGTSIDIRGIHGNGTQVLLYQKIDQPFRLKKMDNALYDQILEAYSGAVGGNTGFRQGFSDEHKFGPHNNNASIPHRAGRAAKAQDVKMVVADMIEMIRNNPDNPELEKHLEDYLEFVKKNKPKRGAAEKEGPLFTPVWANKRIIRPEKIPFGPLGFYKGSITLLPAMMGSGKTSTILKAMASIEGKSAIFTQESWDFIGLWWEFFGGKYDEKTQTWPNLWFPQDPNFPPEYLNWEDIKEMFLKKCRSGFFKVIYIDLLSSILTDEKDNKTTRREMLEIHNSIHPETAVVAGVHIKKEQRPDELLHSLRGATEIPGVVDLVLYLRRGLEKKNRIIIKIKDRADGELEGGYLTKKEGDDIKIEKKEGTWKELLAEYGQPIAYALEGDGAGKKEIEDEVFKKLIGKKINCYPKGTYKMEDFLKWTKEHLFLNEKKARELFRKAKFWTKQDGKGGFAKIQ